MRATLGESWCRTHAPAYKELTIEVGTATALVPYSCMICGTRVSGEDFTLCMDRSGLTLLISELVRML